MPRSGSGWSEHPGRMRARLLPGHGRARADSGARRPGAESSGAQPPAWDRRRQQPRRDTGTPCACPKRARPARAGSRSRADPGLATSRTSACPARVDPEGEGAAGRRSSQHGLQHDTFRVSSRAAEQRAEHAGSRPPHAAGPAELTARLAPSCRNRRRLWKARGRSDILVKPVRTNLSQAGCNPGADHPEDVTPRSREPGAANYSSDANGNPE